MRYDKDVTALYKLICDVNPDMIQTRNLNMDPDWYIRELGLEKLEPVLIGMDNWIKHTRSQFPGVKLGYFNPPREEMKREHFFFEM